jgi:hypothetical protein
MKKIIYLSILILGISSCKKQSIKENDSIEEILSRGNPSEILAIRSKLETNVAGDGPAVEKLYDITISIFSPIEFHEVFCALPATNCLKEIIVTPSITVNNINSANKNDDYNYIARSEKLVSSKKLINILPILESYPSFKKKINLIELTNVKIINDYKTNNKYRNREYNFCYKN